MRCVPNATRSRAREVARLPGLLVSQRSAHSANDIRPARGSMKVLRNMSAWATASHFCASALVANVSGAVVRSSKPL
jgi:hypothetical protein